MGECYNWACSVCSYPTPVWRTCTIFTNHYIICILVVTTLRNIVCSCIYMYCSVGSVFTKTKKQTIINSNKAWRCHETAMLDFN